MLTDARPLFEGLPASFADPLAIAAQQGKGTSSLIVAYYPPAAGHPEQPALPALPALSAAEGSHAEGVTLSKRSAPKGSP